MNGPANFWPVPSGILPKFALVAEMALALACVYVLVRTIIVFLAPLSLVSDVIADQSPRAATPSGQGRTFNFTDDPFHCAAPIAAVVMGQSAPETNLDLKLFGLRSGEAGSDRGSAIIETPDNIQRVYYVEDEVTDGVVLKGVTRDYIVLSQAGRLERLTFERPKKTIRSQAKSAQNANDMGGVRASEFLSLVTLKQILKDGQTVGYEVQPKSAAVDLGNFGLQAGDVLTKIGAQDLTAGRPDFTSLFAKFSTMPAVYLSLLRADRAIIVKVDLQ